MRFSPSEALDTLNVAQNRAIATIWPVFFDPQYYVGHSQQIADLTRLWNNVILRQARRSPVLGKSWLRITHRLSAHRLHHNWA
jgi:hypothetical protein